MEQVNLRKLGGIYMLFTWVLGIIGTVFSVLYAGGLPPVTDIFSGFILGALIDLYILIKRRNP